MTPDEKWALEEASKPSGFCPNAASVAGFATSLETSGWLRRSDNFPVWFITDAGREALWKAMTPAIYQCRKCDKVHTFTQRPEQLPLIFTCDCGNRITVDDPILRALPKE